MTNNQQNSVSFSGFRLTVLGASRGIGREVVGQALARGYEVTAVARQAAELRRDFPGIRVVEGDVTQQRVADEAVEAADAVVCALGAAALSDSRVRSEGTSAIVRAMKKRGVARIAAISLMGAGDSRKHLPPFIKYVFFPFYLRKAVAEHNRQEDILRDSGLDWTVVRPPHLDDGTLTADYAHGVGVDWKGLELKVSRKDVAHFMLEQLERESYKRQAVWVSRRKATAA